MRKSLLIGSLLALAAAITPCRGETGWTELFNGKNLEGWVQRGGEAKYKVENGILVGRPILNTGNSFLCTAKDYDDFVLELEFKVDPALNSGVQIRSECFDTPKTVESNGKSINIPAKRVHGYQVEIDMDDVKARWWVGGLYDEGRRDWLFPGSLGGDAKAFTAQGPKLVKTNDWNQFRVEAKGSSIKTFLNGQPRAEIRDSLTPKGFIGLQVHGIGKDETKTNLKIEFRNIKIKPL